MNIRDFEYLIAVDELKNFSKASQKCFISQPALSQQIRKIEELLGFNIFERDKKNIITTLKGREVIKYAKLIYNSYQQVKQISKGEISLKIGLIPTICPYLLPLIVAKLNQDLPNIRFYFLELKTKELLDKLQAGEIDVGIFAYFSNLTNHKLNYSKLYDEEFFLTLPSNSKLTEEDFPNIIAQKQLILLEEGNCMSDNIKDICSIYDQNSFNNFYATNIETVKNMIKIGNGAALLPKLACLNEKDLTFIKFKNKKTREIGMISRQNFAQNDILQKITQIIQNII